MDNNDVLMEYSEKIIPELKETLEYREIEIPKDGVLRNEIKKAIAEINRCRHFKPTKTRLFDEQYEDLIIPMVMFALAKVGIEGENSHSENGVQRIYVGDGEYPAELTKRIVPLVR